MRYILLFVVLYSCNQTSNKSYSNKESIIDSVVNSNNADSVLLNYWKGFDFTNYQQATLPENGEQKFVDFINIFPNSNNLVISQSIDNLYEYASTNLYVQKYFEELSKRYLYDVNSPFYNENYFILFLQCFLKSKTIADESKIRYKILLEIANKNKVGELATDFTYFANNKTYNLYNIKNSFLVLFFYEVGCSYCEESIRILSTNTEFNNLLNSNVSMMAIYPDGDKDLWNKYKEHIPVNWINGIDLKKNIINNGLYDLKASPTIYLLDENKRVILKDTSIEELLQYFQNLKINI